MRHDRDKAAATSPRRDALCAQDASRRRFLGWTLWGAIGLLVPGWWQPPATAAAPLRRRLSLHHVRSGERLEVTYRTPEGYDTAALADVSHLMRDRRTGEVRWIDARLLDYLFTVQSLLETSEPFHIVSGYRSPETNARLRRAGIGAASNSYHLKGKAVDLWLPGGAAAAVHKAALAARRGGVGYYPDRHFVHLDVGPVRHWSTS